MLMATVLMAMFVTGDDIDDGVAEDDADDVDDDENCGNL